MKAANSAGVSPPGAEPSSANFFTNSGSDKTRRVSAENLLTMSNGTPAGISSPTHESASKPGKTSAIAGTSGAAGERFMLVTPSARNFPDCASGHPALVHELLEARDEKRLLRLQRQLAGYKLLIIDELGYVPLSQTGAELLFEVFSQRYERGSTVVTSNLPFDEWTSVFGSERLTGALLDRLTHHVHILQMNGDSYRLNQSKHRSRRASSDPPVDNPTQA
jgi:hypothetical protein